VIQGLDDFASAKLAILADLERVELTVDAGDDDVDVEVALTPGTGASAKTFTGIPTAVAAPLLSLSADTEAALLFQDDAESLHATANGVADRTTAVLKSTLTDKDAAAVRAALTKWADARGSWMTVGFELGSAPALTLRTPTTDADRSMQAVTDFVQLAHSPALHKMLEATLAVQGVSTATAAVPGFGSTSVATFRRAGSHGKTDGGEVAIAWAATGEILHVSGALSAAGALRASKDPTLLLGSDVALAGKLGTLRDRSAFVFLARPNLGHDGDAPRPSVVLAVGRDKSNGWAGLLVDDVMVRSGLERWSEL
jgi:hypothetical protein